MVDLIKNHPDEVQFPEVIAHIDAQFDFEPCAFLNGDLENAIGQNSGSCKLFQFALLESLSKVETLACFGEYYRTEVLQNPEGTNHQNIRNFMMYGFEGLKFEESTLKRKN
jgi:HopJ type III effector protein